MVKDSLTGELAFDAARCKSYRRNPGRAVGQWRGWERWVEPRLWAAPWTDGAKDLDFIGGAVGPIKG